MEQIVQNNSRFVFVPGEGAAIRPMERGPVPSSLTSTKLFTQLVAKGDLKIDGEVRARAEQIPVSAPVEPEAPKSEGGQSWRSMHHNACLAWIRRCDSVEQLEAILVEEDREKLRAALEARIAELGGSDR